MLMTSTMLRGALFVDAAVSGATGLLLLLAGGWLGAQLDLPATLLRSAGIILLPFAAAVGYAASYDQLSRGAVQTIVAINVAWVVASIALLFTGQVSPNTLGIAFVVIQALAVAALADVQFMALRRAVSS
jgi:hypothetical protein